ncbi:MAG: peptidylprolyl isomerase [Pseudomonadales bacterium]|nr:peptidylprolyl isomerase [Pseudomonadales bacterium]
MHDFIASQKIDKKSANWKTSLNKPPKLKFDESKTYFWHLTTTKGDISIKLMPKIAPMHVSSTIYLTELGFYDKTVFHRVIQGFMVQGGDPLGSGRGGPGYRYDGEFHRYIKHNKPGLLSMANAGPGTDGSQFFLTLVPTPHLDGRHTIFGEIVAGQDTLRKLEMRGSRSGATMETLELLKATIEVK